MWADPRPRLGPARTPLADPSGLPALPAESLGSTLILAPHADDESLGCGGLIASLVDLGIDVAVVIVSDGSKSHPNSKLYPADRLRTLREAEAIEALSILGLDPDAEGAITFLRMPDTAVPFPDNPAFAASVAWLAGRVRSRQVATLVAPWRRDPHCDHRATRAMAMAAAALVGRSLRVLEYPIWAYASPDLDDAPRWDEVKPFRLEIGPVLPRKRAAIAAHRSQTTRLIDDDPGGFCLMPEVLAHFDRPWEIYLESPP